MNLNDLDRPQIILFWFFCIRILLSLDYLFFWVLKWFFYSRWIWTSELKSDSSKMWNCITHTVVEITHLFMIHTFF